MKQKIFSIFKILIALSILTFILSRIDISKTAILLSRLSPLFIVFALLYYTGCQVLSCWRWQIILKSTGYQISILSLLSSYFGGMFLNTFLPGSIGGDVYRVSRIQRQTKEIEVALASVFLERATGIAALLAIAIIGLPPTFSLIGRWDIILIFVFATCILSGGMLLMTSPQILRWTEPFFIKVHLESIVARFANIQHLFQNFVRDRKTFAYSIFLSLLLQLVLIYYYFLIAQQLHISISYLELLVFIPIITIVTLLPLSLGGLGVREGIVTYLFSRIGLASEQALIFSFTITALGWILSLPGGIIIMLDSVGLQQMKLKKINHD